MLPWTLPSSLWCKHWEHCSGSSVASCSATYVQSIGSQVQCLEVGGPGMYNTYMHVAMMHGINIRSGKLLWAHPLEGVQWGEGLQHVFKVFQKELHKTGRRAVHGVIIQYTHDIWIIHFWTSAMLEDTTSMTCQNQRWPNFVKLSFYVWWLRQAKEIRSAELEVYVDLTWA